MSNFTIDNDLLLKAKTEMKDSKSTILKIYNLINDIKKYPNEYEFANDIKLIINELVINLKKIDEVNNKLGNLNLKLFNPFSFNSIINDFNLFENVIDDQLSDTLTDYFYNLNSKKDNLTDEEKNIYLTLKQSLRNNLINNKNINYNYKKYDLTDDEIKQIASLCMQEQGSLNGAKAEASIMANLYELSNNDKYKNLYDYVRNSGWFANSGKFMDRKNASDEIIEGVKSVLVDGKRTLPLFVNEHDCLSDIRSVSNNGNLIDKKDKTAYMQNISKVEQSSNSFSTPVVWTYYIHPDENSDPFGYTDSAVEKVLDELIKNNAIKY